MIHFTNKVVDKDWSEMLYVRLERKTCLVMSMIAIQGDANHDPVLKQDGKEREISLTSLLLHFEHSVD